MSILSVPAPSGCDPYPINDKHTKLDMPRSDFITDIQICKRGELMDMLHGSFTPLAFLLLLYSALEEPPFESALSLELSTLLYSS